MAAKRETLGLETKYDGHCDEIFPHLLLRRAEFSESESSIGPRLTV